MSGWFTGLLGKGVRLSATITLPVRRAFRRPAPGRVVAETSRPGCPAPWMPREPVQPPDWWPPDKELKP